MNKNVNNDKTGSLENISYAQADMCKAYANGSVGILASGIIWLTSAIVAYRFSATQSIWMLLIGGIFIFPLSVLFSKIIGLTGAHKKENSLGNLAMEGTIFMLMCLPIAFAVSLQNIAWFFPAMLLIIGGRYLTFASIYGNKLYWVLGAVLGMAAYVLYTLKTPPFISALTGSIIELTFALTMFISFRRKINVMIV